MNDHFRQEFITHCDITVRVRYFYDHDHGDPWKECDGHGPVREVRYWVQPDKRPGEVVLHSNRGTAWLYDKQAAIKQALAEGWGCAGTEGMTNRQVAAAAVEKDMEYLRGWLTDDWHYVGVVCAVLDDDGDTIDEESCWGFESLNDFHEKEGREMAEYLAERVAEKRAEEAAAAAAETIEAAYWAARDVITN